MTTTTTIPRWRFTGSGAGPWAIQDADGHIASVSRTPIEHIRMMSAAPDLYHAADLLLRTVNDTLRYLTIGGVPDSQREALIQAGVDLNEALRLAREGER